MKWIFLKDYKNLTFPFVLFPFFKYPNSSICLISISIAGGMRCEHFPAGVWQVWDVVDPCLSPLVLLRSLNVKVTT